MELKKTMKLQEQINKILADRNKEDAEIRADMDRLKEEKAAITAEMDKHTENRDFDSYKDSKIRMEYLDDQMQMNQNRLDQLWKRVLCDEAENTQVVTEIKEEAAELAADLKAKVIEHAHALADIYSEAAKAQELINGLLVTWEREINKYGEVKKNYGGKLPRDLWISPGKYPNVNRELDQLVHTAEYLPTSGCYHALSGEQFRIDTKHPDMGYFTEGR